MRSNRRRREPLDAGFMSLELVLGFSLFMIFTIAAINLAVMQYARGSIRAAVEEGARAGAVSGGTPEQCQALAIATFDSLLGGEYGRRIGFECFEQGDAMVARGYGGLQSWMAPIPGVDVDVRVVVTKELAP